MTTQKKSPPKAYQFFKGHSGNPKGRPKGSINLDKLTQKVVLRRRRITLEGTLQYRSLLELVVLKVTRMAAGGHTGAAKVVGDLRKKFGSDSTLPPALIVPAQLNHETATIVFQRFNDDLAGRIIDPVQIYVDPKTPFGIAIDEFEAKWYGTRAHDQYTTNPRRARPPDKTEDKTS